MSEFYLDLQRFGGGGSGKSGGKMIMTVLGFGLGLWLGPGLAMFAGAGQALTAGIYGASIASTIWSVANKSDSQSAQENTSRFDFLQNTIGSDIAIPVIYGKRKWAGNQTWHSPSQDGKTLVKDIIVGEGEIDSVFGVCANDQLIQAGPIFSIKNVLYGDAFIEILKTNSPTGDDKRFRLHANGENIDITLQNKVDLASDGSNDYNCSIGKLMQYLAGYGYTNNIAASGWVLDNIVSIDGSPESINEMQVTPCYNYFENITMPGLPNCSYEFHNGAANQPPPANYETVGGYKNCAWLRATLKESDSLTGGNPTVTYIARGKKVYDPRSGITQWSDNPALCVRDLLLNKRYGAGRWIDSSMLDDNSFAEAADFCDAPVTYRDADGHNKTVKRYTLNIILDSQKSTIEWLGDMFAVFGGFLTFTNDRISLRVEKPQDVAYSFTDDTIIKDSVSFTQYSLDETPNQYKIGYFDQVQNWTQVKVLSEDLADQKSRQAVIPKDISLAGCIEQNQALRLGKLYRDLNRICSIVISFGVASHAMHLEPGDVVNVTWNNTFANCPFRILEINQANGVYQLKGRLYNGSIYNDALGAEIQIKNYTTTDSSFIPPNPVTNLEATEYHRETRTGTIINEIELSWVNNTSCFDHCEVYSKSDDITWNETIETWDNITSTWNDIGNSVSRWIFCGNAINNFTASNLISGNTYSFKVVSVNTRGLKSNFDLSPTITHTVTGKQYTAAVPTNFRVEITTQCLWRWNHSPDGDIDFYELRLDLNPGNETNLLAKTGPNDNSAIVTPPSRQGVVYLYAHNTSGQYSSYPAKVSYYKAPPPVPILTLENVFQGFTLTTNDLPQYCLGVDFYITDSVEEKHFSNNKYYKFSTRGGIFEVEAAFVDVFGDGDRCFFQEIVVIPFIDPALIAAESLSLEKMDTAVAAALEKAQNAVTGTTFDDTLNALAQVDGTYASEIRQTAGQVSSVITELNLDCTVYSLDKWLGAYSTAEFLRPHPDDYIGDYTKALNMVGKKIRIESGQAKGEIRTLASWDNSLSVWYVDIPFDIAPNDIPKYTVAQNFPTFTSILQTSNAVNLRATKANLISQINVCPESISLRSSLVHIAGDTLFDDNVIVSRMLAANSISADKIAAGQISLGKMDTTAQTTINTASSNAETAITNAGTALAAAQQAYNKVTTWQWPYDATYINGGYIATNSVNANRLVAGSITANEIQAGAINAEKISQNSIPLSKLLKEAWTPCWRMFICADRNNNHATDASYFDLNPVHSISIPSLGGISYDAGFDVPAIMFDMNVWSDSTFTVTSVARAIDDAAYFYNNGNLFFSYGELKQGFIPIYWTMYAGNNHLQFIVNNSSWGNLTCVVTGDFINGINSRFNGS